MRMFVLVLSLGTLLLYGRAIAGLWGYMIGQPRPDMILTGLLGGTAAGAASLFFWRKRIKTLDWIQEERDNEF